MSLRAWTRLLFLLAAITVCTTFWHANEIGGSIPLVGVSVTANVTMSEKLYKLYSATDHKWGDPLWQDMTGKNDFIVTFVCELKVLGCV